MIVFFLILISINNWSIVLPISSLKSLLLCSNKCTNFLTTLNDGFLSFTKYFLIKIIKLHFVILKNKAFKFT